MKKLGLVALVGRKQRRKDERKQVKQRKSAGGRIDAAPPAVAKRKLAPETATKADQTMSALKKAKRDHQREKLAKAAAHFLFLGNETRAKSGFVSYVSFFLCFDFDPSYVVALLDEEVPVLWFGYLVSVKAGRTSVFSSADVQIQLTER